MKCEDVRISACMADVMTVSADDESIAYWARRNLPEEEDGDSYECCRRWASLNAFFAHGYARLHEPSYLPSYGISVISDALEQEPWKHPHGQPLTDDEADNPDMKILNVSAFVSRVPHPLLDSPHW